RHVPTGQGRPPDHAVASLLCESTVVGTTMFFR
ncbi:MAG: hypothetical protein ACI91T_002657, partial [Natronomonas sp.]